MQMDATVNFVGALREFHDNNGSFFLHILLNLFSGYDAGNDSQPFFLTGYVKSSTSTCCNKSRDTGNMLHGDAVGLQLIKDIMNGRIEAGISFGNDTDYFILFIKLCRLGIHFIISTQCLFPVLTHGQCETGEKCIRNIQCVQYIGST